MTEKPIIIYGAGRNADGTVDIIKRDYEPDGYSLMAFCDSDLGKSGNIIKGYTVCSREEIIKRYQDFYVYISPNPPIRYEIQTELLNSGFCKESQIINYVPVEKYVSCQYLQSFLIAGTNEVNYCCKIPDWGGGIGQTTW